MDSMSWSLRISIGVAVLLLVCAIGLSIYGGRVKPLQHPVQQTISDDRLPK